ncbi:MAG: thiamine-binding protein [Pirellulales bacterium]|nr:thiamine-binding protein [Pirellulales bacterium]
MFVIFTIQPVDVDPGGNGASRSSCILEQAGLKYRVGPMGTVVQGEWDEIIAAIRQCHAATAAQYKHVVTTIVIDDEANGPRDIDEMVKNAERPLWRQTRQSAYWASSVDRDF